MGIIGILIAWEKIELKELSKNKKIHFFESKRLHY